MKSVTINASTFEQFLCVRKYSFYRQKHAHCALDKFPLHHVNTDRNPRPISNNGSRQVFITLPASSIGQTKASGQQSTRVTTNSMVSRRSLVNKSNLVRDAAQPVPRVISIQRTSNSRVCWFHRNFGPASINCLPPCSFTEMQSSANQPHHQESGLNSAVTEAHSSKVTDSSTCKPVQSLRIPLE